MKPTIVHVISCLGAGRAERMLKRLVLSDRVPHDSRQVVVSLTDSDVRGHALQDADIELHCLGFVTLSRGPGALIRLIILMRRIRPDVVMTWLDRAHFLATFAAIASGVGTSRMVWNLSDRIPGTGFMPRLLALLSRLPGTIAVGSRSGRQAYEALGYRPRHWFRLYNSTRESATERVLDSYRQLWRFASVPFSVRPGFLERAFPWMKKESVAKLSSRAMAALFESPTFYLHEVDWEQEQAYFLRMTRRTYSRSMFLSHGARSLDDDLYSAPLKVVLEQFRQSAPPPRRLGFIFHTALCGSTLLSRCLDLEGVCLAYKEPLILDQFSYMKRYQNRDAEAASFSEHLDLALALLSRTYSPSEHPLIKPSDSSTNLAREVLARHPASAGLLLYARLESFLLSMLKYRRRRRCFIRGHIPRAQKDLTGYEPLAGVEVASLSDAQATAFVWMGLMVPYLALLADDRLRLRSLEASVFIAHPAQTLDAAARLFGLALTEADVEAAINGIFTRNAKFPHRDFDQAAYATRNAHLAKQLTDEIQEGVAWVAEVTRDRPIPDVLPRPLLPHHQGGCVLSRSDLGATANVR